MSPILSLTETLRNQARSGLSNKFVLCSPLSVLFCLHNLSFLKMSLFHCPDFPLKFRLNLFLAKGAEIAIGCSIHKKAKTFFQAISIHQ